ncbi:MAG: flavodoxin family protein [Candidatus Coatesbacteria bacterium]|nr:flavodoxin family protein [Candidatus Coatesbacteria bacterium]
MKILVTYYSKTGNTAELAAAVAAGVAEIDGAEAVLKPVDVVTRDDFAGCEALIIGSPVYFGHPAWQVKKLIDEMLPLRRRMEGKVGAAFASSGSPVGGRESTMLALHQMLLIYGMLIVGDPLDSGGHYGAACTGVPDGQALELAHKLGRRVAAVTLKLRA